MPQLVALILIGGVVWIAARALRREMARIGEEMREREARGAGRDIRTLHKDEDGVYRPRDREQ